MLTATLINYYFLCHRKLWLHAHHIRMEHTSETVADGKFIGATSYPQRPGKYTEIEVGGSKIDFYDAKARVIHEIKRSASVEQAHTWQVKYYIWLLEREGIEGVTGVLEYPKLRQTETITLSSEDRQRLQEVVTEIEALLARESCPPRLGKTFCRTCSYFDFCWSGE